MHIRLSEDPREWRKFAISSLAAAGLVVAFLAFKDRVPPALATALGGVLVGVGLVAWRRPRRVRGLYRAGVTLGGWIGRVVGSVALALMFLLVVVPLGLVLKLLQRDLLDLRPDPDRASRWRPAKPSRLDRQF